MYIAWLKFCVGCGLILVTASLSIRAQDTPCAFDDKLLTYAGSPREQARCLLRPVLKGGHLGPAPKKLPPPFDDIVGKSIDIDRADLGRYLLARRIDELDLGGPLAEPVSLANPLDPHSPAARYFVIHDVSTPNYLDEPFPIDINEPTWVWNDVDKKWKHRKVTHVYISRTGASATAVDFEMQLPDPHHGTKFARDRLRNTGKGLYLHVELIQPRRRDPKGSPTNDAIAPSPGFTESQLERLALVYIAASVRRGEWLVPAFHATVDMGIRDAHDDPQNFDLLRWGNQLRSLRQAIKEMKAAKRDR